MNIFKWIYFLTVTQFWLFADGDDGGDGGDAGGGDDGAGGEDDGGDKANYFSTAPETWRADLLNFGGYEEGEDTKKRQAQLDRVSDPGKMVQNYFDLMDKVQSGEASKGLPADATPEQLSDWREANGIPSEAKGYELGDGYDFERMSPIYDIAHKHGISQEALGELATAYTGVSTMDEEKMQQKDGIDAQQAVATLKEAWGPANYEPNLAFIDSYLAGMPKDIQDDFRNARLADGVGLLNSPAIMQFLADKAREANPAATVVPGSSNPAQTIIDEIAVLKAKMSDDPDAWAEDKKSRNRLIELYTAQESLNS